jgi:hypothetical protein
MTGPSPSAKSRAHRRRGTGRAPGRGTRSCRRERWRGSATSPKGLPATLEGLDIDPFARGAASLIRSRNASLAARPSAGQLRQLAIARRSAAHPPCRPPRRRGPTERSQAQRKDWRAGRCWSWRCGRASG